MTRPPSDARERVTALFQSMQAHTADAIAHSDPSARWQHDVWNKKQLLGDTRIITQGKRIEKGGIGRSIVQGPSPPKPLVAKQPHRANQPFWGTGVSLVLHPRSPHCPIVHFNYRYFECGDDWWFAGGADLTPIYPVDADCVHWHQTYHHAMNAFDPHFYPAFSYWCDPYFYLHHRQETRGIGGTFYDQLTGNNETLVKNDPACLSADPSHPACRLKPTSIKNWETLFDFQKQQGETFLKAYLPIFQQHGDRPFTQHERDFQALRRGRYVEFNLLYDRGTHFGLQSGGRTESILMSLPPHAQWEYNHQPQPGSPEAKLSRYLRRGIPWLKNPPIA